MLIRCSTCGGKGSVPLAHDGPMCYYNPHTGDNWPHVICQSCGGSGWVGENPQPPQKTVADSRVSS